MTILLSLVAIAAIGLAAGIFLHVNRHMLPFPGPLAPPWSRGSAERRIEPAAPDRPEEANDAADDEADRPMLLPVWHVFVIGLGALTLGALLSAESLFADSQRKPFGDERSFWLSVWEPIQTISHRTRLDQPGRWIDSALGRSQSSDGLFVFPEPPADATPALSAIAPVWPPTPEPTPSASPTPTPVPPWTGTLDLWIGGDSISGVYGLSVLRIGPTIGDFNGTLDYRIATGLTRLDYFNWPEHLQEEMERLDPDVVVLTFGANDPQGIETPEGNVYWPFEDGWIAEYRRRVGGTMDLLKRPGRLVIWTGQPVMADAELSEQVKVMNTIYREEAEKREDWVVYLDSWSLLDDDSGNYKPYGTDSDGNTVLLRADDGIHLTTPGADILAEAVFDIIAERLGFGAEPEPTPTPSPEPTATPTAVPTSTPPPAVTGTVAPTTTPQPEVTPTPPEPTPPAPTATPTRRPLSLGTPTPVPDASQ